MTIKSRFAPSPTGYLHIGNARTALITWLYVKKNGGKFLLRIDDTDKERSKSEYTEAIFEDLKWLGLNWDELAYQHTREKSYSEALEKLKKDERIYPCYETAEELALKRKALLGQGLPPIYDRAALKLTDKQIQEYENQGRKPHWRFKLEHKIIEWQDEVRGHVKFEGKDLSDPVVIREDGTPLYHICSVIDDIDYNITHIVRGEDHVANTACHIQMFEALGAKAPNFTHITLLSGKDGEKLSKRLGSLNLRDLRENTGLEARAITSLLAKIGTSDPIEAQKNMEDIIDNFDFSKFSRNLPKFNIDDVYRLNSKILHISDFYEVKDRLNNMGLDDIDEKFWLTIRPNISLLFEVKEWWDIACGDIKSIIKPEDADFIKIAAELLPKDNWSENTWSIWTNAIKEKTNRTGRSLFMPLRLALTGQEQGPELKKLLPLIGRKSAMDRLNSISCTTTKIA